MAERYEGLFGCVSIHGIVRRDTPGTLRDVMTLVSSGCWCATWHTPCKDSEPTWHEAPAVALPGSHSGR